MNIKGENTFTKGVNSNADNNGNINEINIINSNLFKDLKKNLELKENTGLSNTISNILTLRKIIVNKKLKENISEKYYIVTHMKELIFEITKDNSDKMPDDFNNILFMLKENSNIIELLNFLIYLIYKVKVDSNKYVEVLDIIEHILFDCNIFNKTIELTLALNKCEDILLILNKFLVDSIFIDNKIISELSFICLNLLYNKIYDDNNEHYYYSNDFFNQLYDLLTVNIELNLDDSSINSNTKGAMVLFYNIIRVEMKLYSNEKNSCFISSNLKYYTDKILDFHKIFIKLPYEYFLFVRSVIDIYNVNDYFIKNLLEFSFLEDCALEAVNSDNLKIGEISASIFNSLISLNISLDYILMLISFDYIYHLTYLLYNFISDEEIVLLCFRSINTYLKYEEVYDTDTLRLSLYKYDSFKLVEKLIELCENCHNYNDNLEIDYLSKKIKEILLS